MGAARSRERERNKTSFSEKCIESKYKELKHKMRKKEKVIEQLEMQNDEYRNKLRLILKISNTIVR